MSLTVSQGEGLTVITIASNPKSKWPLLCQILGSLCISPVCFVSQGIKKKLTNIHTALGIMQIMIGVINIVLGAFLSTEWGGNHITNSGIVFWISGVAIVFGIMTVLAATFPSPCLLVLTLIMNIVSAALAITAAVLCSLDLPNRFEPYCTNKHTTPSPEDIRRTEICEQYKKLNRMMLNGLDVMIIVVSVLQLCVTISVCVLTGKALRENTEDEKVEDPELHKPLLEDSGAAC